MAQDSDRWIYHKSKDPRIIKDSEYERMEAEGWADSPAKFLDLDTLGLDKEKIGSGDEEECAKAQQALDAVEGVVESINGALNLDSMSKSELEDYALTHYAVNIDKRKNIKKLLVEVKEMAGVE